MTGPQPAAQPPHPLAVDHVILNAVAQGSHYNPHTVLGPHLHDDATWVTIRVIRHLADAVSIITGDGNYPAIHEHHGIWVCVLPAPGTVPDYRVSTTYGTHTQTEDDPYRFLPTLGEMDQHLILEGRHETLWKVLGANLRSYPSILGDVHGTAFAVWAPNAQAVRLMGDFNGWNGPSHAMRSLGRCGVWEIFIPGLGEGTTYKYEILGRDGSWRHHADPLAKAAELPPATASIVTASHFTWTDDEWTTRQSSTNAHHGPISIYELHLGSWKPGSTYRTLADTLPDYVAELGFTHVEFLPLAEHPYGGSWGYQVTGYYAPTSRWGSPDDLKYLINALHRAGIGVILDWVPAHFPKDEWALARFDGEPLYEHPDPLLGEHPDWGTYIFDFGRPEVRNFLVANAVYWLEEFHIDGLRVDAVASMLYLDYSRSDGQWRPNIQGGRENLEAISLLQEVNATCYRRRPGIMMIAEESTSWPGVTAPTEHGLGFGFKWNMGWMNDTLRYIARDPIHRTYHHGELTFSLVYAYSERFILPISHDEVVHGKGSLLGKMPGDRWQQLASVRGFLAYQWAHPGKQLLFMGSEFAQPSEWSEAAGLEWDVTQYVAHQGVQRLVAQLNQIYRTQTPLWEQDDEPAGFDWLGANDADRNVIAFSRNDRQGNRLVAVINFAGSPHEGYQLPVPHGGDWREILNTDDFQYGGSGVTNDQPMAAFASAESLTGWAITLRVPPLGASYLTAA